MKKSLFIALFLICISLFSQEKYKASDYSLPNNVKTYNTFVYKYDVELGKYLIKTFTNEGDVILDNTCGSGSFLVSAILEKRNFIGFEKNENVELFKKDDICYIDICNNRIKKAFESISVCQK